jgi:hypothetical protein
MKSGLNTDEELVKSISHGHAPPKIDAALQTAGDMHVYFINRAYNGVEVTELSTNNLN